ncbi:Phytochrome-like protein cph1 [Fibrisoma limi BUZ 3]|uniref:histidine kinase n=1 Tax=Fibrisoma limi BUZ 3 TaxID=1185876 RepID=I2GIP5_9BACT|nr:PAS domain-containing protein [Fibrisoma limi]CCH53770.1 Phytochrome-like protein cph1 [Fibrisoma limi BUZ 3]
MDIALHSTLPEQTKYYQDLLAATAAPIIHLEPIRDSASRIVDFRYRYVNRAAAGLIDGLSPDALSGTTWADRVPESVLPEWLSQYSHVLTSGQTFRHEQVLRDNGKSRWIEVVVSPLGDGLLLTMQELRQAEPATQRQAERLKFVTDSALTAIALYSIVRDPVTNQVDDLRYELINGRAEQMTGRKAEDLVGRTMRQVFPGIEKSGIWVQYKRLAETGETLRFQNKYVYDGYDLWYEVQGVREEDFVVLSFLDITELKRAQEFNQQQAEEFRQVLDNALTAISHFTAVRDENGQIIDFMYQSFNRISEQITGLKADQVVGKRMLELFPGVRTSGVFDRWVQLVETGHTVRFQDYYQHDGFDFWFDTQAVKWGDGFIQSYIDISLIKQAELTQQKQAELLNAVLNATLTSVACYDAIRDERGQIRDFRFVLANQKTLNDLETTADELYGKLLLEVNPALRESSVFNEYVQVVETGQHWAQERPFRGRWYYVSAVKLGDGMAMSSVDITETYQYRQQIEAANVELRRSNENLEQFAYVASHDLQEPLRKITSFSDVLKQQYAAGLGEQGEDLINRMQLAAQRMSVLIRDLLGYSRLTTQKEPFRPVSLNQVIANVLNDLEVVIQDKQATIELVDLPVVLGNERQLQQLFQNLVSNALKFTRTDEQGVVIRPVIQFSCRQIAAADLSGAVANQLAPVDVTAAAKPRQYWAISLTDNGIGFEQQHAERIFGAFQRLHNRQYYPGTGIGLAIVRKVADNHNGVVSADSKPGQGATFTVYLPV